MLGEGNGALVALDDLTGNGQAETGASVPLIPSSRPAALANPVSGVTPMAMTTISAQMGSSPFRLTLMRSPSASNLSTAVPRRSVTPLLLILLCTKAAIS